MGWRFCNDTSAIVKLIKVRATCMMIVSTDTTPAGQRHRLTARAERRAQDCDSRRASPSGPHARPDPAVSGHEPVFSRTVAVYQTVVTSLRSALQTKIISDIG